MYLAIGRQNFWSSFFYYMTALITNAFSMMTRAGSSDSRPLSRAEVSMTAERLLNDYGNCILRLAYSYLHNMEDAEEIVQDTLIQYLKEVPRFTDRTHEKAWCLRVAGNLSKNRIKHNAVRSADQLKEELVAGGREDLSFVWEAVKSLPENYRSVVHLFYHEGYSTSEIAEILGRNESTVRSHLARGRKQLKAILKEAYDFEE